MGAEFSFKLFPSFSFRSNLNMSMAVGCDKEDLEQRHLRQLTVIAVAFSTVAVIAAVITLPALHSYVQSLHSHITDETEYCKVKFLPSATHANNKEVKYI